MTYKKIDGNPLFTYIRYSRRVGSDLDDFESFKKDVYELARSLSVEREAYLRLSKIKEPSAEETDQLVKLQRGVVIDFSEHQILNSLEIGLIVKLLGAVSGMPRPIGVVPSPDIRDVLERTNITKLENLVLYENQKSFLDEVLRASGQGK